MRAVVIEPSAEGSTLKFADIAEPSLGPEQIRIAVRAASVNRADLAQRAGTHGPGPAAGGPPVVPGLDAAGDVLAVGSDVQGVRPGDRVMTLAAGGLAEQVVVDAGLAVPIPQAWSYVDGAAAILGLLTEHNALRTAGRMQPGETVLVHAAASGVGLIGVRLARHLGAGTVIGTTRSGRGRELVLAHGADHVVQVRDGSFADEVRQHSGERGVDVIVDHVGGPYLKDNVRVASIRGRLVGVGRLGGATGSLDMEALAFKRMQIIGVTFRTRSPQEKAEVVRALREDVDLDQAADELRPPWTGSAPWDQVEQLQSVMASDQHLGKMVGRAPRGNAPVSGDLAGRVAVVTGAGSVGAGIGNGRAAAIRLAEAGARVALLDVTDAVADTHTMISERGGDSAVFTCDVTSDRDVADVVAEIERRWGRVDVLVNNVGIAGPPGTVVDVDLEGWNRCLAVNLTSMVLVSRHVIPVMAAGGGGSIINMSSLAGLRGGHAGIAYATTKGAVLSLTQAMAAHHGPQGIRVNAVAPGLVTTPMVTTKVTAEESFRAARAKLNVLGTEGTAWDVAEAVLWLAGPAARWVTGVVLPVDAGIASFSAALQASITDAGATLPALDVDETAR